MGLNLAASAKPGCTAATSKAAAMTAVEVFGIEFPPVFSYGEIQPSMGCEVS
jgi:hypothetical protein